GRRGWPPSGCLAPASAPTPGEYGDGKSPDGAGAEASAGRAFPSLVPPTDGRFLRRNGEAGRWSTKPFNAAVLFPPCHFASRCHSPCARIGGRVISLQARVDRPG